MASLPKHLSRIATNDLVRLNVFYQHRASQSDDAGTHLNPRTHKNFPGDPGSLADPNR
jgi:hypothetical protein